MLNIFIKLQLKPINLLKYGKTLYLIIIIALSSTQKCRKDLFQFLFIKIWNYFYIFSPNFDFRIWTKKGGKVLLAFFFRNLPLADTTSVMFVVS